MHEEVIFAGFGGQGVQSMGQVLAYSGMLEGKEVCWMPSYGPEMRGGTSYCTVTISSTEISSPIVALFDTVVALNQPSLDKFESRVKPGGTLIYDSTNIINPPTRTDIDIVPIPASETAVKLNNTKVMNMVVLGAFLAKKPVVEPTTIITALRKALPERHHHLLPLNEKALQEGRELAMAVAVA
jgi:2-oxoglutarate ferredoxin oxidoreductase subunit gamma